MIRTQIFSGLFFPPPWRLVQSARHILSQFAIGLIWNFRFHEARHKQPADSTTLGNGVIFHIHHGPRVEKCSFHWLDGLVLDCPIKAINGFPVYLYNRCKKVLSTGRECESPDKAIQWVSPSSVGLILMMVQISGYCSALTFGVRF